MGMLKRWSYLSNPLTIIIKSFNFFKCPVKLSRNLEMTFRLKFNHDFTNHGYLQYLSGFSYKVSQRDLNDKVSRYSYYFLIIIFKR